MLGLDNLGRNYAAVVRVVTLAVVAIIAVLAPSSGQMQGNVLVVLALLVAWSAVYVRRVRRESSWWLTAVDAGVLAALSLSTAWIVPAEWVSTGKSWLVPFVSFAVVVYQYYVSRVLGAACALALALAMVAGTAMAMPPGGSMASIVTAGWSLVLAGLGRLLWTLIRRGGSIADEALADVEKARRDQEVAAALRVDQQALTTALHDTAATTFLMAGYDHESGDAGALAAYARRDLDVMRGYGTARPHRAELCRLVQDAADLAPMAVGLQVPETVWLPSEVAHALTGAVTEALNNAVKHAGVAVVTVHVDGNSAKVRIKVIDHGVGFEVGAVRDTSRGIRESIGARMRSVGGIATVRSRLGGGTVVGLEWADA